MTIWLDAQLALELLNAGEGLVEIS